MTIASEHHDYRDGDTVFRATVATDDTAGSPRPGILVAHTWRGRSEFEDDKARMLAGLGYVGFALDLFGKDVLGSSPEENAELIRPFREDRALLAHRMQRALAELRSLDAVDSTRTGAIGFCFGGLAVLDLARSNADVDGVVSFHGLLDPPGSGKRGPIRAKVLVLHGWDDPLATPDAVVALASELTDAGADWQLHGYGHTLHAFTNPNANAPADGFAHDPAAEQRAVRSMRDFFEDLFNNNK